MLATMAPTVHSAVAASCAPRALQRVMPAGTWPTTCSAPADKSWMTFSLGSLVIAASRAGFEPMGRTMNSTSSLLAWQRLTAGPHVGFDAVGQGLQGCYGLRWIGQPYPRHVASAW